MAATSEGTLDRAIATLDLSQVRRKLIEPEPEGKGWSEDVALEAERWYRRFLHIILKHPHVRPVPNHQIDEFWHQHILDTRAYAQDCETVFGRFLHHYPYFGLNGDAAQRDACFDETNVLYRKEFGEGCLSAGTHGQGCSAPCAPQACSGGGTCKSCTVDGGDPKYT
jgi:hypothetical protein